jgi:repressor LexA
MTDNRPSKKQRELLSFIDGFIKGNGYGPSYREVMRALDYKSVSTVAVHIDGLIKRGLLHKKDHSARSLEVMKESLEVAPERPDNKAYRAWLTNTIEMKLSAYEASDESLEQADVAILIEALRILGFKKEHATLRERFESRGDK